MVEWSGKETRRAYEGDAAMQYAYVCVLGRNIEIYPHGFRFGLQNRKFMKSCLVRHTGTEIRRV
jgi:hypothetical protein